MCVICDTRFLLLGSGAPSTRFKIYIDNCIMDDPEYIEGNNSESGEDEDIDVSNKNTLRRPSKRHQGPDSDDEDDIIILDKSSNDVTQKGILLFII